MQILLASAKIMKERCKSCGLTLLKPGERNPLAATTRGVREMILDALEPETAARNVYKAIKELLCPDILIGLN